MHRFRCALNVPGFHRLAVPGLGLMLALASVSLSFAGETSATSATVESLEDIDAQLAADVDACNNDPDYRVGGAAIGDCLEKRTEAVARAIESQLNLAQQGFCRAADRKALEDSQGLWEQRTGQDCDLIARSPDNTTSFVNGAYCRLRAAYERQTDLTFLTNYAQPRCSRYQVTEVASRAGELAPTGRVPIPDANFAWSYTATDADPELSLYDKDALIGQVSIPGFFCEGEGDNCVADGVHVLQDPDTPSRPLILLVHHQGAHSQRARLYEPFGSGAEPVLDVSGRYFVTWSVKNGTLRLAGDDEEAEASYWPADQIQ